MGSTCLLELVPWQRRQFSYWFTAGLSTLVPSLALMPIVFFCDTRISGAEGNASTGWEPCPLWQSTQVAWRLLLSSVSSAASCGLVEVGNGCPTRGDWYSTKTLVKGAMSTLVGPLWQEMQACSSWPRSRRAPEPALC